MKTLLGGRVSVLILVLLLPLCLTSRAFATEEPHGSKDVFIESAAVTEPPEEGNLATPSDATENGGPEPDLASTGEEVLAWLAAHEHGEGTLNLTADIYFDDILYMNGSDKNITIDTGEFSIVSTGQVYIWCSGLSIRGWGGENGVLRAAEGSALSIGYMSVKAEEKFAIYQEEGAGLSITQCDLDGNAVHYAETPFVWQWKPTLAVVKPGQTVYEVLPETAQAYEVNRFGKMSREEVPVVWELAGCEAFEEQRSRFEAVGSTPGFACLEAPVCTVVYDDFPLTFLEVNVKKTEGGRGESYLITGTFSKPEERLPITILQEYSFDGENWTVYGENEVKYPNTTFAISFSASAWDMQSFPNLYIRLSWNDDGTMYYSNVLRFARDNLEKSEDHGGNRGGGTDIIHPPEPPQPDSEPETTQPPEMLEPEPTLPQVTPHPAPSRPEHNVTDHEADGNEEEVTALPEQSGVSHDIQDPEHGIVQEQEPSGETAVYFADAPPALASEAAESHARIPVAEEETPDAPLPVRQPESSAVTESITVPSSSGESAEIVPELEAETALHRPDAIPIAAGLAAVAAAIGCAAVYLHPKAWKKVLGKLRNIINR